jgi:hypothetical protein
VSLDQASTIAEEMGLSDLVKSLRDIYEGLDTKAIKDVAVCGLYYDLRRRSHANMMYHYWNRVSPLKNSTWTPKNCIYLGFYKALEAGYQGVPLDEDGSDDEGPEADEDADVVDTDDGNGGSEDMGLYLGQGTMQFCFTCNEFFPSKLPAMWMADQRIGTVELCMAYFDAHQSATQNYIGLGYPL